jgi:hypothetical protein
MPESNKNDARKRLSNAKNVSRGGTDPLLFLRFFQDGMPESNKNDARKRLSNAKNVSRGGTDPLPSCVLLLKL